MRTNLLLLSALLVPAMGHAQTVLVNENFDQYTASALIAQTAGAPWTTWSQAPGSAEEASVSTEQAYSGTNSGKWVSTAVGGGPVDMVVQLGNQTSGIWNIDFRMYIPTGKGGYFNILQAFSGAASTWATEISFPANGNVNQLLSGVSTTVGTYPSDTWFPVHITVDLSANQAELQVNGTTLNAWQFSLNAAAGAPGIAQLGALNLYAYAGGTDQCTYYLDDLVVASAGTSSINEAQVRSLSVAPNPTADRFELRTTGMAQGRNWLLRDATGRQVLQGFLPAMAERSTIDIAHLPAGAYFVELPSTSDRHVTRVIKH